MKFKKIKKSLFVSTMITILPPFKKKVYSQGDFTYGEFVLFQNGYPKYYYCAFTENGDTKTELEGINQSLEKFLQKKLIQEGKKGIYFRSRLGLFTLKEEVKEFTLLEIIF